MSFLISIYLDTFILLMKKMTEEEESNFSDGKKLATDYYHCLQNSPEEMYKLVEN